MIGHSALLDFCQSHTSPFMFPHYKHLITAKIKNGQPFWRAGLCMLLRF